MLTPFLRAGLVASGVLFFGAAPPAATSDAAPPAVLPEAPAATGQVGSARHGRVALPRDDRSAALIYFAREAPDAERAAELASIAPGVTIVAGLSREEAVRRAAEAHGADVFYATSEFLCAAPQLRWVQAGTAGVERHLEVPELIARDEILFTNLRGVSGPAIADHAMAMLLSLTRNLGAAHEAKEAGRWSRDDGADRVVLDGRTMLVVGLGGIGTEIAQRAHGFGMRVIATRRSDDAAPAFVQRVGKPSDLRSMLPEADVVAIAVPLTPETEGLFDAEAFAAMRKGSYLINIARGRVVDTDALLAALRDGRLAGAGLDVTEPEPLPPEHPLWKEPKVIITPHISADGALTQERAWAVKRENMRRFDRGEPLLNVVDKRAGY